MALHKPDGSVILKHKSETKKVDARTIAPDDFDFDSQGDLERLWLSTKSYNYNPTGQNRHYFLL